MTAEPLPSARGPRKTETQGQPATMPRPTRVDAGLAERIRRAATAETPDADRGANKVRRPFAPSASERKQHHQNGYALCRRPDGDNSDRWARDGPFATPLTAPTNRNARPSPRPGPLRSRNGADVPPVGARKK